MSVAASPVPGRLNFDFIGWHRFGFILSLLVIAATVMLAFVRGFNFGIDFSGGVLIEARTENAPDLMVLRKALDVEELGEVTLQSFGDPKDIIIRIKAAGDEQSAVAEKVKAIVPTALEQSVEFRRVDYVGPQVGEEMVKNGVLALVLSIFAMLVYIWLRFEWQFGVGGVAALIHDAVGTLGFFLVTGIEFNLTSVAALLTIIGYSINDSVVIYDRIRENMRKYKKMTLPDIVNLSLNETLSRTILTGGTVLLALTGLIIFGGDALRGFSLAMLFGVIIGTYSSIFISAPLLLYTGVTTTQYEETEKAGAS